MRAGRAPPAAAAAARQRRGVVTVYRKPQRQNLKKGGDTVGPAASSPRLPEKGAASQGQVEPARLYQQEGKMVAFYLKKDVEEYFETLRGGIDTVGEMQVRRHHLPDAMVDEMWRYADWHACFSGRLEQKEEQTRRTEFVQFLFDRLGERYKFLAKRNVAMRSRHAWGVASATLAYPRGHFAVVHFVADFDKWNTTETIGQYPKIWPKPHRTVFLMMDMAAHENYRIGMGPPQWGIVTDGRQWKIVRQLETPTGAWDGRQAFEESETYALRLPLAREGYADLLAWLNHVFADHAPIGAESRVRKWKDERRRRGEPSEEERRRQLSDALAGLGTI